VVIVEGYVKRFLHSMLIKCHNHLHLVLECEVGCAYPTVEEDCNLDIFEQIIITNEPVKKFVTREL
jgi:hypothetical protein